MNEPNDLHRPTPEFRNSLKRELRRAYRAEQQFGPSSHGGGRAGRLGVIIGIAAGAVISLTLGLVLGANTGSASAEALAVSQREAAATSIATSRQFADSRLAIARANYDSVLHAYKLGDATKAALDIARMEVDSMEANVARVEVDAKSVSAPPRSSCLSLLKAAPVRNALTALACGAATATGQSAPKPQSGIPIFSVTEPSARTTTTLGAVLGVRDLPGGRLMVNDAGRRQLKIFDASLASATVALDSTPGASNSYGPRPATIFPYLGDSTVITEIVDRSALVLDHDGRFVRAIAMPEYQDGWVPFPIPFPPPRAIDDKGRLVAMAGTAVRAGGFIADSTLIVRADLETRHVDIVGAVHHDGGRNRQDPPEDGKRVVTTIIQPAPTQDSWAVLSDGTIAFVRGHDYHIDWILPDGSRASTAKLPFDWKRLTDEDKQRLADSAKVVWDSLMTIRNKRNAGPATSGRGDAGGGDPSNGRGRSGGGVGEPGSSQGGSVQHIISVPLSEIPDYYPPIRQNAAIADLDGNLWILTTTTAQSQHGELVYDVANPKKGLFERVRMPVGRSIAGFGKGGVIYLQSGDRRDGFYLERVKLGTKAER
jgi:hypothetical protein